MNVEIEKKYSYLWDGSAPGWALIRAPVLGGYCPTQKATNAFLLIEDERENAVVCERMLRGGCEILDETPSKKSDSSDQTKPPSVQS